MGTPVTRLAPSPTGALHLGNARTFLVNWLLARQNGWRVVLRIEDLDGPRVKRGADAAAIDDLRWLGIDWDNGPVYQSTRTTAYAQAIDRLLAGGDAYACVCSRREVDAAASAPHADDGSAVYPGTCRGRFASVADARAAAGAGRAPAVRFHARPGERVTVDDAVAGRVEFDVAGRLGDFVVAKADGTPAYQLAVVVDDAAAGVTHVVRGDDLLDSTPRQMLLYRALGLADRVPRYAHLPLVVGADGRRLAKRHGDTRLSTYRAAGVGPGRVLALLARWCGIEGTPPARAGDLIGRLDLSGLPRTPIVFDEADHLELRAQR
ncbi:MAG TPA: tRNA glutamyl-Q(34) synthetase GluQRS [Tepidisphaeraceae bacterium]|nr:tRNA glutamyl-Q(34) synthetase GluQRS [Tepidisphaeraceae bacterium]